MKILLTGGGSGGHTVPLVAVAEALRKFSSVKLVVIGEKARNAEPPVRRTKTHYISAGKFRRYYGSGIKQLFDWETVSLNIRDLFRFILGIVQAHKVLRKEKPDAIFIKGGYVSLPVGIAAWLRGVPYVTHDSDILPGLTNRILGRAAARNLTGFPVENYRYKPSKVKHVGIPVRSDFEDLSKAGARKQLKIPEHQKRVLLMGGSLGAQRMNTSFIQIAPQLTKLANIVHITGPGDLQRVNKLLKSKKIGDKYTTVGYIDEEIAANVAAADVIVGRAGATFLAELAMLKKPAIIVPNPLLAEGHQLKNGEVINKFDAGIIMPEKLLLKDPKLLIAKLDHLLNDADQKKWLGANLNQLFPDDAAVQVAKELYKLASG